MANVINFVQQNGSNADVIASSSFTVTVTNAPAAGNTLIAVVKGSAGGVVSSISDNQGNTWVIDLTNSDLGATSISICRAYIKAPPTTITINGTNSTAFQAALWEFSGIAPTGATDGSLGKSLNSVTTITNTLTATTTDTYDLLFASIAMGTAKTAWTQPASYTLATPTGMTNDYITAAYFQPSSTSAFAATWSWTGSSNVSAALVAYTAKKSVPNNFQSPKAGDGLSVTEKIR